MTNDQINELYLRQKNFFNSDASKDISFRLNSLNKLKQVIQKNEDKLFEALFLDLHKSKTEAYTSEIYYIIREIEYVSKNLAKWIKPTKCSNPLINQPGKSYYLNEPLGSSLIIGPWNYPIGLLLSPLIGSIAAGNCSIIKPSEISKHTSKLLIDLFSSEFPDEYIAVVEGGPNITQSLINGHTDIVFFTGSTMVGKIIAQKAAENLIPVILELGGKNPCIVDNEIDIDVTSKRIVWGKFFNAGQTCIAPDYLLVHEGVYDQIIDSIPITIDTFYGKNINVNIDYSHIVNENHFNRLINLMEEGEIIYGGDTDRASLFISPTLVKPYNTSTKLMQEEIFGPILPILKYSDIDNLLISLKDKPKPLATYFFSKNKEKQNQVISKTATGNICINGTIHHIINNRIPFGGVGLSGTGKYHGKFSFDAFSNKKSILKRSFRLDFKKMYPPYDPDITTLKKAVKFLY